MTATVTLPLVWVDRPGRKQELYVGEFYAGDVQPCGKLFDAISDYPGGFSCGHPTRDAAKAALEAAVRAMGVG